MLLGRKALAIAFCAQVLQGCASGGAEKPLHADSLPGVWHFVAPGETSVGIAKEAGIPLEDFLEINGLRRSEVLEPGRPVFVLGNLSPAPVPSSSFSSPALGGNGSALLRWPVATPRLSSLFGKRWGKEHEGIDMAAPIGTPIYAAAAGTVIYSGDQVRGYGNMIVLQHGGDLVTVYAHNSLLQVHAGDRVSMGQEIARVGDTGRATAPHLHFEVRRKEVPQDPMPFLPPLK